MFNDSAKLKWQGKEYDCPITMDLVKRMERDGINILDTALQLDKGGIPKVSLVSELYAYLLKEGGCEVTEEQVYESIMSNPADSGKLVVAAKVAISMFFPKLDTPERTGSSGKK